MWSKFGPSCFSTSSRRGRSVRIRWRCLTQPLIEPLEPRTLLTQALEVSNLNDSGPGSLRAAILTANGLSGSTIEFSVTGAIKLTTGELTISADVAIDGPVRGASRLPAAEASGFSASDSAQPSVLQGSRSATAAALPP